MTPMPLKMSQYLLGALLLLPLLAHARCEEIENESLYAVFKQYREQVNVAKHLDELTPYFSTDFNNYYTVKLASAESKTRYLTHYWDNLNTAKDVLIVYRYTVECTPNGEQATLGLLAILDEPLSPQQQRVDLWEVKVHYVKEGQAWLINSFEYAKSQSKETFEESQIVDNFVVIR